MAKRSCATGKCYNHRKRPVRATNKTLCSEKSGLFLFSDSNFSAVAAKSDILL